MSAATLVLIALLSQEEATIARWIEQLADESLETRETAMQELLRSGKAAEPLLRRAAKGENAEIRGRSDLILAAIAKRGRTKRFDPDPSLITLKRENATLKEIVEAIGKQTTTPIAVEGIPEKDRVSVNFEKTPLFKAMDELCRKHGEINYSTACGYGQGKIVLQRQRYVPSPRCFSDQYEVRLESVRVRKEYDFKGGQTPETAFEFKWGWEEGTRHVGGTLRFDDVRDDQGNSYADRFPREPIETFDPSQESVVLSMEKAIALIPPDGASKFTIIKGTIEVVFPDDEELVSFDAPATKLGTVGKTPSWQAKLLGYKQTKETASVSFEFKPAEPYRAVEIRLVDKGGLEHSWHGKSAGGDGQGYNVTVDFDFPAGTEIVALRMSRLVGTRVKRIPFEFRDVRFR